MKITNIFKRRNKVACVHHWVLELPNGPTSEGKCKRCGAVRDFPNSQEGSIAWKRNQAKLSETHKKGSEKAHQARQAKKTRKKAS